MHCLHLLRMVVAYYLLLLFTVQYVDRRNRNNESPDCNKSIHLRHDWNVGKRGRETEIALISLESIVKDITSSNIYIDDEDVLPVVGCEFVVDCDAVCRLSLDIKTPAY